MEPIVESDLEDWNTYNEDKFQYFRDQGISYYANVDASKMAWSQLRPFYFRQSRINVDGLRMREAFNNQNQVLEEFFNVEEVWDKNR